MQKIFVSLLLWILLAPAAVFAQAPPTNEGRDENMRLPLVQFPTGVLREAVNRAAIPFVALPPVLRQQQHAERNWPGRHPVLFGALVGLGVGVVGDAATIRRNGKDEPDSGFIPIFASLGTGIGSLAGLIVAVARR
jgi:hypothetical protein